MKIQVTIVLIPILTFACNKEQEPQLDPVTESLVEALDSELTPLGPEPNQWADEELKFLDEVSGRPIVALGEATHGTSEFFDTKYRVFKYLVENHGFKIFAIEADFGESILINQAVLAGDKNQIEDLMKTRMHFWTWRTREVRNLLVWMCDYNVGKPDAEKVQYWGFDCQFNTYHPDMVRSNLEPANVSFASFAYELLDEAKSATAARFESYSSSAFDEYLGKVNALKDSIARYKEDITTVITEERYALTVQLVEVIRQVSEVTYYNAKQTATKNYRDEYMAKNANWLNEYFSGAKMVVWAHNGHIANYPDFGGSMGHHLRTEFGEDYETIGFVFAKGSFTAVTQSGDQFLGLNTQTIKDEPKQGTLPYLMSLAKEPVFSVRISDLESHSEWKSKFQNGIQFFQIGAVYNNKPGSYYEPFKANDFDQLIFFRETTAAAQL